MIVERDLLKDVKVLIDAALLVFVPPRLVVVERDAKPPGLLKKSNLAGADSG